MLALPVPGAPKPLSRNNQAHLKDKSSVAQSLLVAWSPSMACVSSEVGQTLQSRCDTDQQPKRTEKFNASDPSSVIKDVFSQEQKRQIISKLTDAMVSIE